MEVLASSLPNNAGVSPVLFEVLRDVLPQLAEDERASREMERGERAVVDRLGDDLRRRAGDELDHARWEPCFGEDLVDEVVGVGRGGGGLPDDDVPNECGCPGEIAADRGEVEGRDGKHESFERAILDAAERCT